MLVLGRYWIGEVYADGSEPARSWWPKSVFSGDKLVVEWAHDEARADGWALAHAVCAAPSIAGRDDRRRSGSPGACAGAGAGHATEPRPA